jgi:membrane protease YdiL (CAAX protease family)
MLTTEFSAPAPDVNWQPRAVATAEVIFAALLTCLLWQGFKHFTSLGQAEVSSGLNFSPGIVTILATACLFLLHGKSPAEYGVSLRNWPDNLKTGIALTLMAMVVGLLLRFLFVKFHWNFQSPYGSSQSPYLMDAVTAVLFITFFPRILSLARRASVPMPTPFAVLILLGLWTSPLGVAYFLHRPLVHISLVVLGLIVTTGFGEECFYWGYIQPRLNEVWGRTFCFGGIRFGWGLVMTSLLFGLIHSFNGVDLLHGHFTLNWGWGLFALIAGSIHGLLREGTGSIVAGTVLHGIKDVWLLVIVPTLLA